MKKKATTVLMILDGWGYREATQNNAIAEANTPQWDEWWRTRPHMLLNASGQAVGLPDGQMGNSEVGHMHIGAGRIVQQDFTRINNAIETGIFFENSILINAIEDAKRSGKTLHVLGLLSDGGVHSHENHLFAFLRLCFQHQFFNVALHLFLDGRDTAPASALASITKLEGCLKEHPVGRISSISGRFYAMDRDNRWDRIERVYRLLTENISDVYYNSPVDAINHYYQQGIFDEFLPPTRIGPGAPITSGDSIFFFNFRPDRARELVHALITEPFNHFERKVRPPLTHFISMTSYDKNLLTESVFSPINLDNTLGQVVADHGLTQLRIAETEKYAHVTFFLNGGVEQVFSNEQRILIQSPLIRTYDLQPEMSAPELTRRLVNAIESQQYDLIVCNYANADMVGHTGNFQACVKAIESLDMAMHETWKALECLGGQLLITADHGNAECMFNPKNHQAHTAHTTEPVPLLYIGFKQFQFNANTGSLIDIAPTVLMLLGIAPPDEMTGNIVLVNS
jgi:2,3-bisphosphoglycerate-independent phosphoglycerate mutase